MIMEKWTQEQYAARCRDARRYEQMLQRRGGGCADAESRFPDRDHVYGASGRGWRLHRPHRHRQL